VEIGVWMRHRCRRQRGRRGRRRRFDGMGHGAPWATKRPCHLRRWQREQRAE
jgi:hypothetical protein